MLKNKIFNKNKSNYKIRTMSVILAACMFAASGCGQNIDGNFVSSASPDTVNAAESSGELNNDTLFTKRDMEIGYDETECETIELKDSSSQSSSDKVGITQDTVTITAEGTYIISGSLNDGSIVVDAGEDKVRLILNNADISNKSSAAIYVKSADKVFITLAPDSKNTLKTTGEFVAIDERSIDAVIFSMADIVLNGSGSLELETEYGNGITSKDDLKVTSGVYYINASKHGLEGKDGVMVSSGEFTITSGEDGINAGNDEDETVGYVYISGGSFSINAGDDGIHSDQQVVIAGGKIDIAKSEEGIEGKSIEIKDGDINIVSADDGLNATDGSGSDRQGFNMEGKFPKDGERPGDFEPGRRGEKPDRMPMDKNALDSMPNKNAMPDKEAEDGIPQKNSDADDNFAKNAEKNMERGFKENDTVNNKSDNEGNAAKADDVFIRISGGNIEIDADGDGIDSNGSVYVTGGCTYVWGAESGADSAIDYEYTAEISGGIIAATGYSQMAQNFGSDSTQGAILVNMESVCKSGSEVELTDSKGNELISFTAKKSFNSVLVSCPDITKGESYVLKAGSESFEVTMEDITYSNGMGMGMRRGRA